MLTHRRWTISQDRAFVNQGKSRRFTLSLLILMACAAGQPSDGSRVGSGLRNTTSGNVALSRCTRTANRTAIDLRCEHCDQGLAVKARIVSQSRPQAGHPVQKHAVMVLGRLETYSHFRTRIMQPAQLLSASRIAIPQTANFDLRIALLSIS
jgi:hypothetical protein